MRAACHQQGCETRDNTRERVGDASYCVRHAREARRLLAPSLARCALDDWADDVTRRRVHTLGCMDANCGKCGSNNFSSERIGTRADGHFSICCDNGKRASCLPSQSRHPFYKSFLQMTHLLPVLSATRFVVIMLRLPSCPLERRFLHRLDMA